jgi:cell division topological specificity factor
MKLLHLFSSRRGSAPIARERLQILLSHERVESGQSDLVALLQKEILAVVEKHITVDRDKIQIKLERGEAVSMLEIDIEMPISARKPVAARVEQPAVQAAAS